jgi:NitT/TauT family transport system substrate-binding protein
MKRRLLGILIVALVVIAGYFIWSGQQNSNQPLTPTEPEVNQTTLLNPEGPTVIPVAGVVGEKVEGDIKVNVQYWKTNDEAMALLSSGNADFAVLPVTAAANMYASGLNIALLGVHEWKVFYMVASQEAPFENWQSLKGKQIYIPVGKGNTVDVLLRSALAQSGLVPDRDVTIVYSPPQEIVQLFKTGKVDYAALPEPFVTMAAKGGNGKIVVDFQEYWAELSGGEPRFPIAGLFVHKNFLDRYPKETSDVAHIFAQSTSWSDQNADEALTLSADILPIPAPIMKEALTRIDFTYVPVKECQQEVDTFLKKMQELYPEGIKQIPDAGFYAQ